MKAMLFLCAIVSTGAIYGMEGKTYTVTVHNNISSEITLDRPASQSYIGSKYYPSWIDPYEIKKFSIPQRNSHFRILLPNCYQPSSININVDKDNENIYISRSYLKKRDKSIVIETSSGERFTINASMSPAKYQLAKKLILEEKTKHQNPMEEHCHLVNITNLLKNVIEIAFTEKAHRNEVSYSIFHQIKPEKTSIFGIERQDGGAYLQILLNRQVIPLRLTQEQKNIAIKQDETTDAIVIIDEKKVLDRILIDKDHITKIVVPLGDSSSGE